MKRVFFHIHIWKTGGTSFLNTCQDNFGDGFHRDIMLVQDWFLSPEQLRWILDYHGWVRCYSCHMLSGNLPYDADNAEVIGLAFVRNPVDRFISSYNFARADTYRGGYAKGVDFDDYFTRAIVETDNPLWRNGQTRILGGSRDQSALDRISALVEQGKMVLLPTERFDEACLLLEKRFPDDFRDCSYTRSNVSKTRQSISESQRAAVADYMQLDTRLLTMANDGLDASLARLFPTADARRLAMEDFHKRCALKKRRQKAAFFARKIERGVGKVLRKAVDIF